MKRQLGLAIHGGAGTIRKKDITEELQKEIENALQSSMKAGLTCLEDGQSALSAAEAAVKVMEDSPLFNAGRGCVFTANETIEMDASIMCGKTLAAGAVTCVQNVKNPISLARRILTDSRHVLLSGAGAENFAKNQALSFESNDYFRTNRRLQQLKEAQSNSIIQLDHSPSSDGKFGTVGAVALDSHGNLAAATSTGGMTNQAEGRVGDTPIIGAGNYANNQTCAVSCTGIGEGFMRAVTAFDVSALMAYKEISLDEAAELAIFNHLTQVDGEGGLIAIDKDGNVSLPFNSEGMYRGWLDEQGEIQVRLYKD